MARANRGKTSTQTVLTARKLRGRLTDSEEALWSALRDGRLHPEGAKAGEGEEESDMFG